VIDMYSRFSRSSTSPNSTKQPPPVLRSGTTSPATSQSPFSLDQAIALVHSSYLEPREEQSRTQQVHAIQDTSTPSLPASDHHTLPRPEVPLPAQNTPDIRLHPTPDASRAPKVVPPSKPIHSHSNDNVPSPPSDFRRTVYNTFTFSLKLVETLAEIFPVPGIKSAIGTLNVTIERFDVAYCLPSNTIPHLNASF
jgi:hypothetical protein